MEPNTNHKSTELNSATQGYLKQLVWVVPILAICGVLLLCVTVFGLIRWMTVADQVVADDVAQSVPSRPADGTTDASQLVTPEAVTAESGSETPGQIDMMGSPPVEAKATVQVNQDLPDACNSAPLAWSRASDSALLGPISFASRQDESGWPLDAGQQFATSVKAVHAAFGFDGMRNGMPWERVWYFGDQELLRTGGNWDAGSRGRLTVQVKAGEGGFVAGNYRLEIYAEGELLGQASFVMFADEAPLARPIEVAYTTLDSDTHQINRLDLDSGEAEPLLVSARYPAWSADATGLLFYGERGIEAGTPGLWVLNISQGKSYQLNEETAFRSIAWSPQRTFMATSVITDQAPHLTLLDLARNKVFSGPLGEDPVWSPEGHRLAYRGCGSGSWNISTIQVISNVFDIDTIQTLTEADDSQPAWSQDGQRIAFVRDEGGNQDIYVISADARELTRLTDHPAVDTSPAWTPDNRLLFRSLRSGQWGIYVMDADGENQRLLLDTPSELTWQPDGLAVTSDVTWLEAAPPPVPKPRVQVPAGRGLLVVSNRQNNDEMTFTIDNTEHKVAPYQVRTLPLKPGQYTWTASWPAKVSRTGLADIALGQVAYPVVER